MKTLILYFGLILTVVLSSCSSISHTAKNTEYDDRYYSLADANKERRQLKKLNKDSEQQIIDRSAPSTSNREYDDIDGENMDGYSDNRQPSYERFSSPGPNTGNTQNNYYFDMDDYHDYQYASRVRRFHRPMNNWGYYDPFYTNYFWYDPNPLFFGQSIYSTYGFWNPYSPWGWNSWGPSFNMGWNSWSGFHMGFGMGPMMNNFYNPWGWNSFYRPWGSPWAYNPWGCYNPFMWGMPMQGYGMGFNNGFAAGMAMNSMMNNQMHFNSFDSNTYSFGPNTGGIGGGSFSNTPLNQTFTQSVGTNFVSLKQTAPNSATSTSGSVSEKQLLNQGTGATNIRGNEVTSQSQAAGSSSQINVNDGAKSLLAPEKVTQGSRASQMNSVSEQQGQTSIVNDSRNNLINQGTATQTREQNLNRSGQSPQPVRSETSRASNIGSNYNSAPVRTQQSATSSSIAAPSNVVREPNISPGVSIRDRNIASAPEPIRENRISPQAQQSNGRSNISPSTYQNNRDFSQPSVRPQVNQPQTQSYRGNVQGSAPSRQSINEQRNVQPAPVQPQRSQQRFNATPQQQQQQSRPNNYYNTPQRQTQPQYNAPSQQRSAPSFNAPSPQRNAPNYNAPSQQRSAPSYNAPQRNAPSSSPRMSSPTPSRQSAPMRSNSGGSMRQATPRR